MIEVLCSFLPNKFSMIDVRCPSDEGRLFRHNVNVLVYQFRLVTCMSSDVFANLPAHNFALSLWATWLGVSSRDYKQSNVGCDCRCTATTD